MLRKQGKQFSAKQKAAILLLALGAEASSKVLRYFSEEEVEELSLEIARLGTIPASVQAEVVHEFYEMVIAQEFLLEGGPEQANRLLEMALGAEKGRDILQRITKVLQLSPFDSLKKVDPAQLASFLQDEHPQTIALVLAYLGTEAAAAVITLLPAELRPEVAARLATMERTLPEVIQGVENVLQQKLAAVATDELSAAGGVKALAEILSRVDRNTERLIFDALAETNPELLEEVRKMMFTFEDLLQLDDRAIQQVLKEVEIKELALALKGASETVKQKIFKNMSERAVNMLQEEMEFMGPVRLRMVEEAQQRVVSVVRRLEEAGEIVLSRGGEDDVLV